MKQQGAALKTIPAILLFIAGIVFSGCMSQQSATRQTTHEFIADLPNHPKTEVYDRVVKWAAGSFKSVQAVRPIQDPEAGSIVRNGNTVIQPEGSWVKIPVGFTMNIDVRNEKMRVRFTNLRRLYGSKKSEEPLNDDFFKTQTAIPYQEAAQLQFASIVQNLMYFVEQGTVALEGGFIPLSSR